MLALHFYMYFAAERASIFQTVFIIFFPSDLFEVCLFTICKREKIISSYLSIDS